MTDPTRAIEVLRDKGAYIKGKDAPVPVIKMTESAGEGLAALIEHLMSEVERYQKWVNDLQAGMMVNCVYCGHRYGPAEDTPVSMADVLKEHIEHCPKHPMSKIKAENDQLTAELAQVKRERDEAVRDANCMVRHINPSEYCKNNYRNGGVCSIEDGCGGCRRFRLRGVCAENGDCDDV